MEDTLGAHGLYLFTLVAFEFVLGVVLSLVLSQADAVPQDVILGADAAH